MNEIGPYILLTAVGATIIFSLTAVLFVFILLRDFEGFQNDIERMFNDDDDAV